MVSKEDFTLSYKLAVDVRKRLAEFFREAKEHIDATHSIGKTKEIMSELVKNSVKEDFEWKPDKLVVADGGSNLFSLNIGSLGIYGSVAVVIKGNHIIDKLASNITLVPDNPSHLLYFESTDKLMSVTDKLREATVFEQAVKAIEKHEPELAIIDGPLVPYGPISRFKGPLEYEEKAYNKYVTALKKLHATAEEKNIPLIGFVKRPMSSYLFKSLGEGFIIDHIILNKFLKPTEFTPSPPQPIPLENIHDEELREIAREMKLRYTYFKTTSTMPPFRIDFSKTVGNPEEIIAYLYHTKTRDGIPVAIMKADEETKMTKNIIRELYQDALHDYIHTIITGVTDPQEIIPFLPLYGEDL